MSLNAYNFDVAIVGAGPAGLAAASAAKREGADHVVVLERDFRLGGILEQCIHVGFGLKYFGEELSGPEYASRFIHKNEELGVDFMLNTMVLGIDAKTETIQCVNPTLGNFTVHAGSIVLAMGCRERTRAAIQIPGTRPAGVFTAGTAQRYMNVQNLVVGKKVAILGSGDIGMIMARRFTLENLEVAAVIEIMPYLTGLTRNKVQCLDDFNIPLYLSHTITEIKGEKRVEGITVSKVDSRLQPVQGTTFDIDCDTLLLSVGLIPENELSRACGIVLDPSTNGPVVDNTMQTNIPGIFACGNVVHVNDLVDNVSQESETAGKYAAKYALGHLADSSAQIHIAAGDNVRYVVPQNLSIESDVKEVSAFFRVQNPDKNVTIFACCKDKVLEKRKRKVVNPGEIEILQLDMQKLLACGDDEIVIKVVKD
jgi:NADPH-dependent 2,4-dienoyl-CoA reductase/sulfur reductase-like enzyme